MLVNNTHTNYGNEFKSYYANIKELITKIEYRYKAEKLKGKQQVEFSLEQQYQYLKLLHDGIISLREINDFEASKIAIYKGIPLYSNFISRVNNAIKKGIKENYNTFATCVNEYWNIVGVGARYSLHFFIKYMYHNKTKQPYRDREDLLAPAVFYVSRGLLARLKIGIKFNDNIVPPNKILFSTFPSSGKTLIANYSSAWIKCLAMIKIRGGGLLRIGNEEGNVNVNSQTIKNIISDETILGVFPEMKDMRDKDGKFYPFAKDSIDEWYLKEDKEAPYSAFFRTSSSATNGIRINIALIVDDPSRGMVDRNNVEIHKKIISSYNGDWLARFDNEEDAFVFLIGTRFNNFDVFSSVQDIAESKGLIQDSKFANVLKTEDGKTVIINIDCEDDNGNSKFPKLISNETLNDKRNSLSKQEYSCVYRQRPLPEEGLDFDYCNLKTYDRPYSPNQLEEVGVGSLDPTRNSGADFLSLPIFKKIIDKNDEYYGKYAFVGCVFRKKSIKDDLTFLHVLNTITRNNVRELFLETNTDTSLGKRMKDQLGKFNYGLNIKEIYNTANKSRRIADQTQNILNNVVFPRDGLYSKATDMGAFMENLTTYSSERKNKHDDAPDALATFSSQKIDTTISKNTIKFNSKSLF